MITASSDPRTLGRSFGVHRTLDTVGAALGPLHRVRRPVGHPRRLPDGVRHLVRLRGHRARRARPAGARPAPAPRGLAHAAPHRARRASCPSARAAAATSRASSPPAGRSAGRSSPSPACAGSSSPPASSRCSPSATASSTCRCRPATASPPSGSRCCTSAPTSPTCRSRCPSAGWRTGSAGRGSSSGATSRSSPPTCARASRPPRPRPPSRALLLLGLFYAATDGVLAALVGRRAAPNVRASAIGTAQTVVAVARMASSALVRPALVHRRPRPGDPVGRGPARRAPCPVAWFVVRGLDAPEPALVDAGDGR